MEGSFRYGGYIVAVETAGEREQTQDMVSTPHPSATGLRGRVGGLVSGLPFEKMTGWSQYCACGL